MMLRITDPDHWITPAFVNWLIDQITSSLTAELDDKKLSRFDSIFAAYNLNLRSTDYSKDIFEQSLHALVATFSDLAITISIDPKIHARSFDRLRLLDACKLINYGNLEIPGYPIFSKVFEYFADNLPTYIDIYKHTRGK